MERLVVQPRPRPVPAPAVKVEERPYMGFDGQNVEPELAEQLKLKAKTGVLVTDVVEGAPAALAGLKKNDVIQGVDGAEIKARADLEKALAGKKPEQEVKVTVLRDDQKVRLEMKLGVKRVEVPAVAGGDQPAPAPPEKE